MHIATLTTNTTYKRAGSWLSWAWNHIAQAMRLVANWLVGGVPPDLVPSPEEVTAAVIPCINQRCMMVAMELQNLFNGEGWCCPAARKAIEAGLAASDIAYDHTSDDTYLIGDGSVLIFSNDQWVGQPPRD